MKYGSLVRITQEELLNIMGITYKVEDLAVAGLINDKSMTENILKIRKHLELPEEVVVAEYFFEDTRDIVTLKLRSEEEVRGFTYPTDEGMPYRQKEYMPY